MKLKDFISTSLQEIIQGVKEAQANANEAGGVIMPPFSGNVLKNEVAAYRREMMRDIEFDVAVAVVEDNEKGISAGAFISVIGIGISGKEKNVASECGGKQDKVYRACYLSCSEIVSKASIPPMIYL